MPKSKNYREYEKRFKELRKNLLPAKFSLTGDYNSRIEDRARAFYVLIYGEIEAYFEEIAKEIILSKISNWKNKNLTTHILITFLASYHVGWQIMEDEKFCIPSKKPPIEHASENIDLAHKQYCSLIANNHGIKIDNLKRLFIPLGVDFKKLDNTWLVMMDDFGLKRGKIAHDKKAIHQQIDPLSILEDLIAINKGIEEFDEILQDLQKY
jgi:hypothetical protein